MLTIKTPILIHIWRYPKEIELLTEVEIELLIRQSKAATMTAVLFQRVSSQAELGSISPKAKLHFESAQLLADRQREHTLFELKKISAALSDEISKIVVLKGAAYIAKDLPGFGGRIFSDIDILVPKEELRAAESELLIHGWFRCAIDDYDEKYYRTWAHEIPPLAHKNRGTSLDLHHNILPLTVDNVPDIGRLLEESKPLPGLPSLHALQPIDMLLHSAIHLFYEGEFVKGLRDLTDLELLFEHFSQNEKGFWTNLLLRANQLELERPVYYAIRYTHRILGCQIPQETIHESQKFSPTPIMRVIMDFLFINIFIPHHSSCKNWKFSVSKHILYWRGHLLRMPLKLLIPHLFKKSTMRIEKYFQKEQKADA